MPRVAVLGPNRDPFEVTLDRDVVTVGRSRSCELALSDPMVSREHGRLSRTAQGWRFEDLGSRHGSLVNGRPVRGAEHLEPGDRISVGHVEIVFEPPAEVGKLHRTQDSRVRSSAWHVPVGDSRAMAEVRRLIERFAPSAATVLIQGETGTGKELLARLVHELSDRAAGPFVVVNCPALPESLIEAELFGTERGVATGVDARPGLVETADGGSLFLDEVGDLAPAGQAKLLRFLQDRRVQRVGAREPRAVDVRIIAATHRDLAALVAEDGFRRDLYHRLEIATVDVPPLRERGEDIPQLVDHFLALHADRPTVPSAEALSALIAHAWPGNVRELEHAVQRAALLAESGTIELDHLPRALREAGEPAGDSAPCNVDALVHRLTVGGESFWDLVREPFLRRELSRADARAVVGRLLSECDGSHRALARRLGLEAQYRKLVDFLRNNALRPEDEG